jgi:site-specific DNA-methyltransferase (adenine-specific)
MNSFQFKKVKMLHADCLDWLQQMPECSVHGIVTDPPYAVREYADCQLEKRLSHGGVWRLPPVLNGSRRSPVPRFTDLSRKDIQAIRSFFEKWAVEVSRVLCPGGHVFMASNALLSQFLFGAVVDGGLEFRGEVIRLVMTLRGGDRPKGAHKEFPLACTLPRSCYEPWGVFRKPLEGRVQDCLRSWGTGALRMNSDGSQFKDVIQSARTSQEEKAIASHPSLKPQEFLRKLVWAVLPTGNGIVLDPFAGSGSTLAAAVAVGYEAIGIERIEEFYNMSKEAIPTLSKV